MRTLSSLAIARTRKDHALAKTSWQNCHNISPMKKTVNDHFLFQASIQLPCFLVEYSRSSTFGSIILWYFDFVLQRRFSSHLELSHQRLPNIWLRGEHSDPIGTICTQAYVLLKKKHPSKQAVSRCSRPNLLAVSLPLPAFITLRAQPNPPCYTSY